MQKSCIHFQLCMHAYSHMYCMQSASMATNSIILLLVLSISCLCSTRDVYIQPSEGEHCPGTCYNISTLSGRWLDNFSNSFGLNVHFLEGTHMLELNELVVFNKLDYMLCLKVMGEWSRAFMRLSGRLQWSSSVLNTPVLVSLLLIAPTSPSGTSPSLTVELTCTIAFCQTKDRSTNG